MNSWQADRINMYSEIWSALKVIYEDNFDNWKEVDKEELWKLTMKETKNHFNPRIVKTIIDNL